VPRAKDDKDVKSWGGGGGGGTDKDQRPACDKGCKQKTDLKVRMIRGEPKSSGQHRKKNLT